MTSDRYVCRFARARVCTVHYNAPPVYTVAGRNGSERRAASERGFSTDSCIVRAFCPSRIRAQLINCTRVIKSGCFYIYILFLYCGRNARARAYSNNRYVAGRHLHVRRRKYVRIRHTILSSEYVRYNIIVGSVFYFHNNRISVLQPTARSSRGVWMNIYKFNA